MPVTAMRLRNFRGFPDVELELKPLTLLLGPNSAGKSSFGHAIAALRHARKLYPHENLTLTPDPDSREEMRTWPADLGRLAQLRTEGRLGPVEIGLRTAYGWVDLGFGLDEVRDSDLRLSLVSYPQSPATSEGSPEIHNSTPVSGAATDVSIESGQLMDAAEPRLTIRRANELEWKEGDQKIRPTFEAVRLSILKHERGTDILLNGRAADEVDRFLDGVRYLRATRKRPQRAYPPPRQVVDVGYAGEWVSSLLNAKQGDPIEWLEPPPVPPSGSANGDLPWIARNTSLHEAVAAWLSWLDLAQDLIAVERKDKDIELKVTMRTGAEQRFLTDVGFGISQVLPVLVAGLLLPPDGLLVVDLPEAHLHPRPQAALADFLCSLVLGGRRVLVETHSEMLFHRLRLRFEMTKTLRHKIGVYFIDPPTEDGLCAWPRPVGLSFDDEVRWPERFLDEAWETEAAIRAVREAQEKELPK